MPSKPVLGSRSAHLMYTSFPSRGLFQLVHYHLMRLRVEQLLIMASNINEPSPLYYHISENVRKLVYVWYLAIHAQQSCFVLALRDGNRSHPRFKRSTSMDLRPHIQDEGS